MSAPDRHERWFPELEPPPGGLRSLRARIADDERRRTRRFRLYAAVAPSLAAACAVLVFLVLPREAPGAAPPLDSVVAARLGLAPMPDGVEIVHNDETMLRGVPHATTGKVEIVWIGAGSLPDGDEANGP